MNDECFIYLIDCMTHKVSYVGYTNMKTRFSNNKSHFKKNNAPCELINHLISKAHNDIDFSCINNYDDSLSKHVKVILIEKTQSLSSEK